MRWLQANWIEVRYRLVVVGIAALVLGASAVALRGSVRFGPPPPYNPPVVTPYEIDLTFGNPDFTSVGGTITSHAPGDCPNLVLSFNSGRGYLSVGPVPAGAHLEFPPYDVLTWDGRPYSVGPNPRIYLACEPSMAVRSQAG